MVRRIIGTYEEKSLNDDQENSVSKPRLGHGRMV